MISPIQKLIAFSCAAAAIGACASHASHAGMAGMAGMDAPKYSAAVMADVDRMRGATRKFQTLDSAVAAGYIRDVKPCIVHAGHPGAMGFHHRNAALLDVKAEVERPELLLYERLPNGTYQLNGAEYIVQYKFWPRDTVPPVIFGQNMKQEDNFKYWYLHLWAFTNNPYGLFADFNPNVQCSDSSRTDYTPSYEKKP
jgi:hypothetical protein